MQNSSQIVTVNKPTPNFSQAWMAFPSSNQQCRSTEGSFMFNYSRRSGSALDAVSQVTLRRARLLLGWATDRIGVLPATQLSTQSGHPFVGRRNEYQQRKLLR